MYCNKGARGIRVVGRAPGRRVRTRGRIRPVRPGRFSGASGGSRLPSMKGHLSRLPSSALSGGSLVTGRASARLGPVMREPPEFTSLCTQWADSFWSQAPFIGTPDRLLSVARDLPSQPDAVCARFLAAPTNRLTTSPFSQSVISDQGDGRARQTRCCRWTFASSPSSTFPSS